MVTLWITKIYPRWLARHGRATEKARHQTVRSTGFEHWNSTVACISQSYAVFLSLNFPTILSTSDSEFRSWWSSISTFWGRKAWAPADKTGHLPRVPCSPSSLLLRFQPETYEKSRASQMSLGMGERGNVEWKGRGEKERGGRGGKKRGGERRKEKVFLQLSESLCDRKAVSLVPRLVEASGMTTVAPHMGHWVKIIRGSNSAGSPPSPGTKRLRNKGAPNFSCHLGAAWWLLPWFYMTHVPH